MASATLMSNEVPPARAYPPEVPNPKMELTYTGNTGNDMGIGTMGYRAAKYNTSEWDEGNYAKYYQSFVDRDSGERVMHEANRMMHEVFETTTKGQDDVTKKLGERCKDIDFWKNELERETTDVIDVTDKLLAQKRRLENALRATEIPLHIATDNLNCRQRRQGIDLCQDKPEISLLKEVEVINNVRDLIQNAIAQTDKQIRLNRDAKQNLEFDWSDKKEALEIDCINKNLQHHHTNKQFHEGAASFAQNMSTPESWAQFTHDNIARAEHERMASLQLSGLVDNILDDTTRDMTEQNDTVKVDLHDRITEYEDAKAKLEDNLRRVVKDIADLERKIDDLKAAIRALEDPMKKAQQRLYNRSFRPGVDLCRDDVQYGLISEVNQIAQNVDALKNQLNKAENALKDLQDDRLQLEQEISNKKNSIFIDKDKCLTVRERYPTTQKLLGYNAPN